MNGAIKILTLALMLFATACSKDEEPSFTSVDGTWTYSTPDNKMKVDFDLVTSGSTVTIQRPVMILDGVTRNAEAQITGASIPTITSIRIFANDAGAVYPFDIIFNSIQVSTDFKTMTAPTANYKWPWPEVNDLADVVISRK